MTCRCESCLFTAAVCRIQEKLSKCDAAVIEDLLLRWANGEDSAAYWQARARGTWPNADIRKVLKS